MQKLVEEKPLKQAPAFWQWGVSKLKTRRVPEILQMDATECGAACLTMVLNYYGRKTDLEEVREACGAGRDGISALSLVKAARQFGLRVRAISLRENDFRFVQLPAIVYWQFNHYLVVEKWSPKSVKVVDPAFGRRKLSSQEFDEGFTGVVLTLEPGAAFSRQSQQKAITLGSYLLRFFQAPGVLAQILLASLVLQLFSLVTPFLTQILIDQIIPRKLNDALLLLGLGILVMILLQTVISLLRSFLLMYLHARLDSQLMLSFFEHLLSLPYKFFLQRLSGDLLARSSSNAAIRDILSERLISTILDSGLVFIYLILLLTQFPLFGALAVGLGLLQVITVTLTTRPLVDLSRRQLVAEGKSHGYLTEVLTSIATLKATGTEYRAFERWSNLFFDQLNLSMRYSYLSNFINAGVGILQAFSPMFLLWLGVTQVLEGKMTIGTALAFNAIATGFTTPLYSLVGSWQQLQMVRAHFGRITDVLTAEPEQTRAAVVQPPPLSGAINLEKVNFSYAPDAAPALRDINLQIQPGQKVAVVGRTGSGKSTLGKLLLGLFQPTSGEICYDGLPLKTLDFQALRRQFGVVLQESAIFSGSIRQNIALSDPEMSLERVMEAARLAVIDEDINQMPMGYETFVAEGGNALSGGQRQRLALARAVAHSPCILLLDEATSHLDVATEQRVEQNLNNLENITRIVIAHRLSTIRNADLIVVLEQGTIVERGTHAELVAHHGVYARLVEAQLNGQPI